jgi:multidrug transporter EmrE-like cation transporter
MPNSVVNTIGQGAVAPAVAPAASGFALLQSILGRWWIAFSLSVVCVVSGHLLIKAGLNHAASAHGIETLTARLLHIAFQPQVVIGLAVYLFGTACWMIAVSQKEISFLYPLSSVNYVLVTLASAVLLAESISVRRAEGIALIVLGSVLLNRKSRGAQS